MARAIPEPAADERTRVTRRELGLICRYGLVQAGLDLGHALFGARLLVVSEIYLGTGLAWLARYTREAHPPAPDLDAFISDDGADINARGVDFFTAAAAAVDLATLAARRSGHACVRVHDLSDLALAPALTESAGRRGLATIVRTVPAAAKSDAAGETITTSVGWPGQPPRLTDTSMNGYGVGGELTLLAAETSRTLAADARAAIGDGVASLSARSPESVDVRFDLWVELLEYVGGTLPPDGRGVLTRPDEATLHDAGPGAGKLDDDD